MKVLAGAMLILLLVAAQKLTGPTPASLRLQLSDSRPGYRAVDILQTNAMDSFLQGKTFTARHGDQYLKLRFINLQFVLTVYNRQQASGRISGFYSCVTDNEQGRTGILLHGWNRIRGQGREMDSTLMKMMALNAFLVPAPFMNDSTFFERTAYLKSDFKLIGFHTFVQEAQKINLTR